MGWDTFANRFKGCTERKDEYNKSKLEFGIKYLDLAADGINQNDLVLVGAPSGVGKTAFVTNLALTNAIHGKKVSLLALEAYEGEIEDRVTFTLYADRYFDDQHRLQADNISFREWYAKKLDRVFTRYDDEVAQMAAKLTNFQTFYMNDSFTIDDFVRSAFVACADSDLIVIDHAHYFDIEDQNENRGFKEIVKKIRWVQQELGKPVVLVSHLRKADRKNGELVAGMDEFHGSSDLTKIATKVITIAKGDMLTPSRSETYFRVSKNRIDGSVTFYTAKLIFNFTKNTYDDVVILGKLTDNGKKFEKLNPAEYPYWAKRN